MAGRPLFISPFKEENERKFVEQRICNFEDVKGIYIPYEYSPTFIAFILKMLIVNPLKRPSAQDLLEFDIMKQIAKVGAVSKESLKPVTKALSTAT